MTSVNLDAVLSAVNQKGYLIDDQLMISKKISFAWIVLLLKMPFYRLMGWDVFEHVRVDQVAKSLLEHYKNNNAASLEILIKIIDTLNVNTHLKYQEEVCKVRQVLARLGSVANLSFKWPEDMTTAIQQEVGEKVRKTVQEKFLSNNEGAEQEHRLHVCFKQSHSFSVNVFISENKVSKVFLIYKDPIASGAERSVKSSIDLLQGFECIKKPLKPSESEIYTTINSQFTNRVGILPEYFFMYTSTTNIPRPITVYEKRYGWELGAILRSNSLSSTKYKFQVIEQLITGLSFFHTLSHTASEKQFELYGVSTTIKPFHLPFFHKDIQPANILYSLSNNTVEVRLTDFGFSNAVTKLGCKFGYRSWDTWNHQFIDNVTDPEEVLKIVICYNIQYGQTMDMWAMGAVFAAILLNGLKHFCFTDLSHQLDYNLIPPLESYQNFLSSALAFARDERRYMPARETTQRKITEEITSIKNSLSGPDSSILCSLWDVIGEMLTVNSDIRITAQNARDKILEIKK